MKIFDEDGNYLGEFIDERIESASESISDSFAASWILGILCFLWQPVWTIIVILSWIILRSIYKLLKLSFKCIWWLIRVPFTLIFSKEWPTF